MFSLKRLAGLLFGSFLAVSCTPLPPVQPVPPVTGPPNALPVEGEKTPEQIEAERAKLEEEARKRDEALAQERAKNERVEPVTPPGREEIKPPLGSYPTAKFVRDSAGKPIPGLVYNPYTGAQVDVKGIPSGTKIRDPKDGNPKHVFYVP